MGRGQLVWDLEIAGVGKKDRGVSEGGMDQIQEGRVARMTLPMPWYRPRKRDLLIAPLVV